MKPTLSVLLLSSMLGCAGSTAPDQGDAGGDAVDDAVDDANPVDDTDPVLGALSSSDISDVVRDNTPMIKACYEEGLAIDPELAGRVDIKIVIGSTGAVTQGEVNESTLDSLDVEDCILDVMTGLQFPEPEGGGIVIVTYPFVLAS